MPLVSAALRIATVALLFLARIRFPAHNLLVGTLWKRYGQDMVKEVRPLEKLDFKYRKPLKTLIREHNLTINHSNQKLFISVQIENNKNKI